MESAQRPVVGIGYPVEYMGRLWTVKWITSSGVVLQSVGEHRETVVALAVFERLFS